MEGITARPRVIRGTRTAPLPLLPSGSGGVCSRPLHGARDLTRIYRIMRALKVGAVRGGYEVIDALNQQTVRGHHGKQGPATGDRQPEVAVVGSDLVLEGLCQEGGQVLSQVFDAIHL